MTLRPARRRATFFLVLATLVLCALEARYFQLQVIRPRPAADAAAYKLRTIEERGQRGRIFDRRGGLLVHTRVGYRLSAWAPGYRHGEELAEALHEVAGLDPAWVERRLQEHHHDRRELQPVLIERVEDPRLVRELDSLSRRWPFRVLHLDPCYEREFVRGELASPLLGFVDVDGVGRAGIESLCDERLRSSQGERQMARDGRGRSMQGLADGLVPDLCGADVQLTLCPLIQGAAERALDGIVEEFAPKWTETIVVDPRSGEILALAQRPCPPPGRPTSEEAIAAHGLLPAQQMYVPGSTMKPLMMALCLARGVVDVNLQIDCERGLWYLGRRPITDIRGGYGVLSLPELLVNSSNIGMSKIAMRLLVGEPSKGDPQFAPILDYYRQWGFGAPVLGLPGEMDGLLTELEKFSRTYTLASMSYGHEMANTLLQTAAALAGLVNEGRWQPLQLVLGPSDEPLAAPRQVVPPEVARTVRSMLGRVVDEGTTGKFRPRGYSMGAKTGTAQKDHDKSKDCMSFVCFAPVEDPRVLCVTVVDEPSSGRYSSEVVAPAASHLLAEALKFLDVPPDRPGELEGRSRP